MRSISLGARTDSSRVLPGRGADGRHRNPEGCCWGCEDALRWTLQGGCHVDQTRSYGKDGVAYHVEWGFRREAFVWDGDRPDQINCHPYAIELRSWLLREGSFAILRQEDRAVSGAYTNPHTWSYSSLLVMLAHAMDDSHAVATSTAPISPVDAEIARLRRMNEQVMCVTRICEAMINQLLHCTQIPKSYYKNAALGALMSTECRACRNSDGQRHEISLLCLRAPAAPASEYGLYVAYDLDGEGVLHGSEDAEP